MEVRFRRQVTRAALTLCSVFLFSASVRAEEQTQPVPASMFDAVQSLAAIAQPSPLMLAIIANDALAVRKAIAAGADVNATSSEGVHPALLAGAYANEEVFKGLIAADMDIAVQDAKGRSAVHLLAMRGGLEPMKLLLLLKPELAQKADVKGWIPLFIAYANGHFKVAEFLMFDQLDSLNRLDASGVPLAFHFAANIDAPQAITHMIEHKLNVFKRNAKNEALHEVAAMNGHNATAKLLEAHYESVIQQYKQKLREGRAR